MEKFRILKNNTSLVGNLSISGSKSISNRGLIIEAMSATQTTFNNLSTSDDTVRLLRYLRMIEKCRSSRIPLVIDTGNAGTVMRFLAAFLSLGEGQWLLTGSDRMKERPIGDLVDVLKRMDAKINYPGSPTFPPLMITGSQLKSKQLTVDVSKSSQFVSALMMIGPALPEGLVINFSSFPVSFSYIEMTAGLMKLAGADVSLTEHAVHIKPGQYKLPEYTVEPDWSSASYWYEMAAFSTEVDFFLASYQKNSLQGDSALVDIFKQLGVNTTFENNGIRLTTNKKLTELLDYDCSSCPDLVPAILTTCAALGVKAKLSGVGHLKYKESDRIEVFKTELQKIGAELKTTENSVELYPMVNKPQSKLVFDTYKDHRVAMSLAPLALMYDNVIVNEPGVVEKSYQAFWEDVKDAGALTVDKI